MVAAFSAALRHWRRAKGLTQQKLGDKAGISGTYVALFETGQRSPRREVVLNLAAGLELNEDETDEFLARAGHASGYPVVRGNWRDADWRERGSLTIAIDTEKSQTESLLPPQVLAQSPPPFMAGHHEERLAVENYLNFLCSRDTASGLLAFGWPGTAKSLFPLALAFELNKAGFECGFARVRCQALTAELSVEGVRQRLAELAEFINECQQPKVIVFDELDALAPTRGDNPALLRLSTWVLDFLDVQRGHLKNGLIVGITNNPAQVDPAVLDRLPCSLYFDLPDGDMIEQILRHLGIPQADAVSSEITNELSGRQEQINGRNVHGGAELAKAYFDSDLPNVAPAEIAGFMLGNTRTVTNETLDTYRHTYRGLISRSEKFRAAWQARAAAASPAGSASQTAATSL